MHEQSLAIKSSVLRFHHQRDSLFNELHTRPFPLVDTPAHISHLAVLHQGNDMAVELAHIRSLCVRYSVNPPTLNASCYYQDFGGFELRWERHTEFSTYTFVVKGKSPEPFLRNAINLLPDEWLSAIPGSVVSAINVEVARHPDTTPSLDELHHYFEGHRLIGCYARDEKALIWTAYRIHSDGLGRFILYNMKLNPCQTGRLVRRVLELETYRMMALLAFPLARQITPEVREMDQQLTLIIQQITDIEGLEDERRLLGELSTLSARVEQIVSDTNYRFSATQAYYDLVMTRIDEMREKEISGHQTLKEFLSRRLTPAYRTCMTVSEDLDDLAERIDRASELLRTRVELTIEAQNQALLKSMDRRSELQLRLQQAVEGLSVVVISYYLVGLIKYVAGTAQSLGWIKSASLIAGVSVPLVVGVVWFGLARFKKKLEAVDE